MDLDEGTPSKVRIAVDEYGDMSGIDYKAEFNYFLRRLTLAPANKPDEQEASLVRVSGSLDDLVKSQQAFYDIHRNHLAKIHEMLYEAARECPICKALGSRE